MDRHTRETAEWADDRFRKRNPDGTYYAHEPIYGVSASYSEPNQARRLARTYSIFRRLAQMDFDTLLDVGGAEGYHANLARHLFAARVVTSDVSFEGNLRARDLFGLPAVTGDAHWLPYADNSFDVVMCCEVLEHVSDPVAVMCEAARVARRYALFSTEQVCRNPRERDILMQLADLEAPHVELHYFLPSDFTTVLGPGVTCEREGVVTGRCAALESVGAEPAEQETRELVLDMTRTGPATSADYGIIAIKAKGDAPPVDTCDDGDEALLDAILAHKVRPGEVESPGVGELDPFLKAQVACPVCLEALAEEQFGLACPTCQRHFPVERGVPRLYPDDQPGAGLRPEERRWPRLTDEGRQQLRAKFVAPRIQRSRLFYHILNIELSLLGFCEHLPPPEVDHSSSNEVRRAIMRAAYDSELPTSRHYTQPTWWDNLPSSSEEIEGMRGLNAVILTILEHARSLEQYARSLEAEYRRQIEAITSRRLYRWSEWLALRLRWLLRGA